MRNFLLFLTLVLAACGGDGDGVNVSPEPVQHAPQISNLTLSPDNALYMEGGGSVQVTAEFAFTDLGQDIETLHIEMSDGTSLVIPIPDTVNTASGTLVQDFDVTTADANGGTVEIWLVDSAGQSSNHLSAAFSVIPHTPEISNMTLSLDSAMHMEGGGSVTVTAVLDVADAGQDIDTLVVAMSNGVTLNLDVWGLVNGATGTITKQFDVATTEAGLVQIRVQLVDAAGSRSARATADFAVQGDLYKWYERVTGLPNTLNDVVANVADGTGFVAVGDGGTIMTSEDGLTWSSEWSPTDVDLHSVRCYPGSIGLAVPARCFAAGDAGTVLVSPNGWFGPTTWSTWFDGPDDVSLRMHDYNPFLGDIAVGRTVTTDVACILQGSFASGPVTVVEPLGRAGHYINDIARDVLDVPDDFILQYLATVEVPFPEQAKVLVSNDLLAWVEVFVSDDHGSTYAIMGEWISGSDGKMYASDDGINWTQYQTPATQTNLVVMDGHDGMVMAHGFSETIGMGQQVGVATIDGGDTWQMFVIGSAYEPRGLAYYHGRWVSVGQSLAEPGEGAILTTE